MAYSSPPNTASCLCPLSTVCSVGPTSCGREEWGEDPSSRRRERETEGALEGPLVPEGGPEGDLEDSEEPQSGGREGRVDLKSLATQSAEGGRSRGLDLVWEVEENLWGAHREVNFPEGKIERVAGRCSVIEQKEQRAGKERQTFGQLMKKAKQEEVESRFDWERPPGVH